MTRDEQIAQIKGRRYGPLAEQGNPYWCAETVTLKTKTKQCQNYPGHGLGGLFCWQHAKNNPEVE